ncbi:MAG: CHC2 zinc finger domain-containing protein [Planctomycetaceae bacterium]|nr:CHC2 zinc finger domain-containing protein [Planctomycetaceae bacterium]
MSAAIMTRDHARQMARERLIEVLADVVPGFRPERPFRCLSPGHEDRHPSARYLSRTKTVRCFSCGWSGDVFDVVGAVYGLAGGDAFKKAYELLGIDGKGGIFRTHRPVTPKHTPGSNEDLRAIIYPPGWNDPEPEVKLPIPLAATAAVEKALSGILARHPEDASICRELGLEEWHFDDRELGAFYSELCAEIGLAGSCPDFIAWLVDNAAPRHMLRRLTGFVVGEGQRRKLEAALAMTFSHFQNEEPARLVLEDVLNAAELAMRECYDLPDGDESDMHSRLDSVFGRWMTSDDPRQIIAGYRRLDAVIARPIGQSGIHYG